MPAQTQAGLHAKAQLLRSLVPGAAAQLHRPDRRSPDEQLLGSVLDDLLGPMRSDQANEDGWPIFPYVFSSLPPAPA